MAVYIRINVKNVLKGEVLLNFGKNNLKSKVFELNLSLSTRDLPEINLTSEIGLDPDWVEACAFAWLAKQRIEKKAGNLPSVTGASKAVVLGGLYLP